MGTTIPPIADDSDVYGLVSTYGVPFTGAKALTDFPRRCTQPGFCIRNSAAIALRQPSFRYVEGLCWYPGSKSVHHAWLTADGIRVVDPTYGDEAHGCRYFGIIFPSVVLQRMIDDGHWDDSVEADDDFDYAPFGILQLAPWFAARPAVETVAP